LSDPEKVTSLFGGAVSAVNQPVPELVAFIERLLTRAKSGEMRAIAVAYVRGNGLPSEGWSYDDTENVFLLHSGIACLFGNFTNFINSADNTADVTPPPDLNSDE